MYNEVEVKAILIAVHNIENVGGTGSGEGEFISPSAITMCKGKMYV